MSTLREVSIVELPVEGRYPRFVVRLAVDDTVWQQQMEISPAVSEHALPSFWAGEFTKAFRAIFNNMRHAEKHAEAP